MAFFPSPALLLFHKLGKRAHSFSSKEILDISVTGPHTSIRQRIFPLAMKEPWDYDDLSLMFAHYKGHGHFRI